ncbi:hypothetical protein LCGC14_1613360 [marine sediment metagenome]|uniref:Uncharacterized protein n=1 Tax=marine sediment metagenome TaxID=412755 RepID=A0A0F9I7W6_9ZZZZ
MDTKSRSAVPQLLVVCLSVLGVVSVIAGLSVALTVLSLDLLADKASAATLGWTALSIIAGCCAGTFLWAVGWLCRKHHQQDLNQRRIARALEAPWGQPLSAPGAPSAGEPAGPVDADTSAALLGELRELNVNVLLSEPQREAKRRYLLATRAGWGMTRALGADEV